MSLQTNPRPPIGYVRDRIPEFDVPTYAGVRYEAVVPDTLDLQERAAQAVNALTEPTDPNADYELYWRVFLGHSPAMMQHDLNDFLAPLIYLNTRETQTLAIAIRFWQLVAVGVAYQPATLPQLMAMSTIITIPPVLVFFFLQRYFIQGVVVTGIKG